MNIFLQIFLYFDVFVIGAVFATAVRHAYAHYRPHPDSKVTHPHPQEPPLSKEMRDKLILEAQSKYQKRLDESVEHLSKELGITADKINQVVSKLAGDILSREQAAYQQLIKDSQKQAEDEMAGTKAQTASYQAEIKAKLDADAAAERQRLIDLIDHKLADSIMAFLLEAMGHEVDL
ncbi:MAG: hypothetical protein ACREF7_01880, partial [Candidatus Saccharimonadales bacterium]